MPKPNRAHSVILPTNHGRPCAHYFVAAADGQRFCAVCGRYEDALLRETTARQPPEPAAPLAEVRPPLPLRRVKLPRQR